jgi:hypothetical protein
MTTKHFFSRSLATLSAIFALTTGVALTAAPSTARAEMKPQIVASGGAFDIQDFSFGLLSFRDVVAEVQSGGRIVITAQVLAPATAGRPRTGNVVFSALVNSDADGSFMDYTDDACTTAQMSGQASDDACAAIAGALQDATAGTGPFIAGPAATEGIIMRDGGICNPRWGC